VVVLWVSLFYKYALLYLKITNQKKFYISTKYKINSQLSNKSSFKSIKNFTGRFNSTFPVIINSSIHFDISKYK
jgi:hypothetical protein